MYRVLWNVVYGILIRTRDSRFASDLWFAVWCNVFKVVFVLCVCCKGTSKVYE